ncbi:MAG: hypothetical protein HY278_06140 [candidate division NC10 bacterium]|nr:hypothetical protein [candidate division NC10 bacterium]
MAVDTLLEPLFWSEPPEREDRQPTDPLGLDAMREELSDRLVPCLTGRTRSTEDFFWTLVFLRWGQKESTGEERERSFLKWERALKIWWIHRRKRNSFSGVKRARQQAQEQGAPSTRFRPLLKNQKTIGMLGAHLGPLRKLGFVESKQLALTEDGTMLSAGAGFTTVLKDQDWKGWNDAFRRPEQAFDEKFKRAIRTALKNSMPHLYDAIQTLHWPTNQAWGRAARFIGNELKPYARLAHEFCGWADEVRAVFDEIVKSAPNARPQDLPARLATPIPRDLLRWKPLRLVLNDWNPKAAPSMLAQLHLAVFRERGYENELWLRREEGKVRLYPGRATTRPPTEGSDCRWANAVNLMSGRA